MSKQILIVDDEEDVRAIAKLGLEMGAGWQVLTARSGEEALVLAATHQPDAILLDLMMPDMDGRDTLKQLKTHATTQTIPVILVTAKLHRSESHSFADLEVAAVITKPFRPLNLATQIKTALQW